MTPFFAAALLALSVRAEPPVLVRIERPVYVHLPNGGGTHLPAGAELGACGGTPIVYSIDARTVRVTRPCGALFRDGFE